MSNRKELTALYKKAEKNIISCPVCSALEFFVIAKLDRYFLPVQTVCCNVCAFVYTNPRPSLKWFEDFYKFHYRFISLFENVDVIDEAYLNRADIISKHDNNISFLYNYVGDNKLGSLLDIGSAEGLFIKKFKEVYTSWKTTGIEPSLNFSEFSKGYSSSEEIINDVYPSKLVSEKYDIIHSSHVLEHVYDLNDFISSINDNLNDNGLLFIDVPNIDSVKTNFKLIHLAHLYHFSERTLTMLLKKHGFDILDLKSDMRTKKSSGKLGTPWTLQVIAQKTGQYIEPSMDNSFDVKAYQNDLAKKIKPKLKKMIMNVLGL